jgi:hypothetical protein
MIFREPGFAVAQEVAGAWWLDDVTTTGTDGKTAKFTQPNIYLFTKSTSASSASREISLVRRTIGQR